VEYEFGLEMTLLKWMRAILSFPFALAFFNFDWHEATWEFRELLGK